MGQFAGRVWARSSGPRGLPWSAAWFGFVRERMKERPGVVIGSDAAAQSVHTGLGEAPGARNGVGCVVGDGFGK